jgi:hypothetical protein
MAMIAFASVNGAFYGTFVFGFWHQFGLIPFLTSLLQCVVYGYVALYLLTSSVRQVFVRPVREALALPEKTRAPECAGFEC